MIHNPDWIRDLTRETAHLYHQLEDELGRQAPDQPDPSTPSADLSPPGHEGPPQLVDGRTAIPAARLLAGTITATQTRHGGTSRRGAPGSAAPLDLNTLAAQEAIYTTLDNLLADLRHAKHLPHRGTTIGMAGLVLPLIEGLAAEQEAARWLTVALAHLDEARTQARRTLGLDTRLLALGPCPSVREPYPAAWDVDGTTVIAVWDDGLCRAYAGASASRTRAVDTWRRSHLLVDVGAGTASPGGDIHCRTCLRRWAGDTGRRDLAALMA